MPADLTGTWRSAYTYPSSSRGEQTSEHQVTLAHDGNMVRVHSYGSPSRLLIDLEVVEIEGQLVLTGTWTEDTDPDGPYEGVRYRGGIQLLLSQDERKLTGRWIGHDRALTEINTGSWDLERVPGGS